MLSTSQLTVGFRCTSLKYSGTLNALLHRLISNSFYCTPKAGVIYFPANFILDCGVFFFFLPALCLNSPTQEAYFNTASPPTRVSRASPRPEGFVPRAVFKTPGRQAAALARRQERYAEFDATTDAFSKAETQEDVNEVCRIIAVHARHQSIT